MIKGQWAGVRRYVGERNQSDPAQPSKATNGLVNLVSLRAVEVGDIIHPPKQSRPIISRGE